MKVSSDEFIISDINGRFNRILRSRTYEILLKSQSLEDFITHLGHFYPSVVGTTPSRTNLSERLRKDLEYEEREIEMFNVVETQLFFDLFHITAFFKLFENTYDVQKKGIRPKNKINLELHSYVEDSPIKRYLLDVPFQYSNASLRLYLYYALKTCLELYFERLESSVMKELIMAESDLLVLEISSENESAADKRRLFPSCSGFTGPILDKLAKANSEEEIESILGIHEDSMTWALKRLACLCEVSFRTFGDTSCVYAYLRLREFEVRNLLWAASSIEIDATEECRFVSLD